MTKLMFLNHPACASACVVLQLVSPEVTSGSCIECAHLQHRICLKANRRMDKEDISSRVDLLCPEFLLFIEQR
jgi:hypothetical protein